MFPAMTVLPKMGQRGDRRRGLEHNGAGFNVIGERDGAAEFANGDRPIPRSHRRTTEELSILKLTTNLALKVRDARRTSSFSTRI